MNEIPEVITLTGLKIPPLLKYQQR